MCDALLEMAPARCVDGHIDIRAKASSRNLVYNLTHACPGSPSAGANGHGGFDLHPLRN